MDTRPDIRRPVLWVFLFFCLLYCGLTRGHFISTDEVLAYEATSSLWQAGVPAVRTTENYGIAGRDRYIYSVVSSGQSIAVLPLYALGHAVGTVLGPERSRMFGGPPVSRDALVWSGEVEIFFVSLWNAIVTAGLCAVFFAFLLRLGQRAWVAWGTTLLLGTTSYVVGYSSTFYTQPVEALGMLWAFYLLFLDREKPDVRARLGAGLIVAFTLQCRYPAVIMVPGLLAYQAWTAWRRNRRLGALALDMAPLVAGVLLGLGLHAADQYWKFGTVFSKGGYEKARWDAPLLTGLWGLLLSPGASIFVYSPLLLLAPAALPGFFERHRAEAWFVAGQATLYLILFSMFPNWHGLWCFGPRYLVPIVPLLMLPLGAWLEARGRRSLPFVVPLALAGAWVQSVHLLANFWLVFVQGGYMDLIKSYEYSAGSTIPGDFLFIPHLSPVLAQSRAVLAMDGRVDLWFVWLYREFGVVRLLLVAVPWLLALAWCGARTVAALGGDRSEPAEAPQQAAPSVVRPVLALLTAAVLLTVATRGALPGPPVFVAVSLPRVSEVDEPALINEAVELLYQRKDPAAALPLLEKILAGNPDHYGANFQKARALDAAGRPSADQWRHVLVLAERVHDEGGAKEARARLAR